MTNIAVLGAVWGDEGKGHITHHFSKNYDWVVRYGGGANAGHTIYRDGVKYVHNLLPSVDFRHPHVRSYLGAGMVIDLRKLLDEVSEADKHFANVGKTIYVDRDAFVVLEKHKAEDKATNAHIGSTNRGIGPCYKDKVGRSGVRIGDLLSMKANKDNCEDYGELISILYSLVGFQVTFTSVMAMEEEFKKSRILFEGAQGVLLDINHGIYPFVSSSDCCISGIVSSGFGFVKVDKVYGVAKAYTTKVGEGPFPTEYHGEEAEELRKRGHEYGATTGRPRRVGCLDLPALRYACKKGGITNLIMTKFDILDGVKKVKVCKAYKDKLACSSDFFDAKPIYDEIPGWENAKTPGALELFLDLVEHATGLEVDYISCGTSDADILSV
jgi:adenylosuccinate synthase